MVRDDEQGQVTDLFTLTDETVDARVDVHAA